MHLSRFLFDIIVVACHLARAGKDKHVYKTISADTENIFQVFLFVMRTVNERKKLVWYMMADFQTFNTCYSPKYNRCG